MVFEKRNFMGIELDVLIGHPEHDLLFVATQVARAAGLENPKYAIRDYLHRVATTKVKPGLQMRDCMVGNLPTLTEASVRAVLPYPRWRDTWLLTEASVYQMLLRGHSPKSEPFRQWVAEEVLPSIRKTGKYNAEDSTNPIAQGIMDRLMSLEGVVLKQNAMLEQMQEALGKFAHAENAFVPAEPSPYEGQTMIALCDPAGFNARTYRELAEYLPRPAVDKLEGRVVLQFEVAFWYLQA